MRVAVCAEHAHVVNADGFLAVGARIAPVVKTEKIAAVQPCGGEAHAPAAIHPRACGISRGEKNRAALSSAPVRDCVVNRGIDERRFRAAAPTVAEHVGECGRVDDCGADGRVGCEVASVVRDFHRQDRAAARDARGLCGGGKNSTRDARSAGAVAVRADGRGVVVIVREVPAVKVVGEPVRIVVERVRLLAAAGFAGVRENAQAGVRDLHAVINDRDDDAAVARRLFPRGRRLHVRACGGVIQPEIAEGLLRGEERVRRRVAVLDLAEEIRLCPHHALRLRERARDLQRVAGLRLCEAQAPCVQLLISRAGDDLQARSCGERAHLHGRRLRGKCGDDFVGRDHARVRLRIHQHMPRVGDGRLGLQRLRVHPGARLFRAHDVDAVALAELRVRRLPVRGDLPARLQSRDAAVARRLRRECHRRALRRPQQADFPAVRHPEKIARIGERIFARRWLREDLSKILDARARRDALRTDFLRAQRHEHAEQQRDVAQAGARESRAAHLSKDGRNLARECRCEGTVQLCVGGVQFCDALSPLAAGERGANDIAVCRRSGCCRGKSQQQIRTARSSRRTPARPARRV